MSETLHCPEDGCTATRDAPLNLWYHVRQAHDYTVDHADEVAGEYQ